MQIKYLYFLMKELYSLVTISSFKCLSGSLTTWLLTTFGNLLNEFKEMLVFCWFKFLSNLYILVFVAPNLF